MADLDALAERLNRALDRIERAVAQGGAGAGGAADPTETVDLKRQIATLSAERAQLLRDNEALQSSHRSLQERFAKLERAGADASSRLAGAIAGIDRLLRTQRKSASTP